MKLDRNAEGYHDPTPGEVFKKLSQEEREQEHAAEGERLSRVSGLVPVLRTMADLAGFEIIGRIPLRDKATGKEYR